MKISYLLYAKNGECICTLLHCLDLKYLWVITILTFIGRRFNFKCHNAILYTYIVL